MTEIEIKPLNELPTVDDSTPTQNLFDIEKYTYDSLNYEDFFSNHMTKNIPCIIKNIGIDWDASAIWVKDNELNYEHLANEYGTLSVPITSCKTIKFDHQPRYEMKFIDYINYFKHAANDKMLYLKDWHLRKSRPEDPFYAVPQLFASDWLNEYALDKGNDDFMFVYMGPDTSWTPMHADVYSSFSWSVNVFGTKKWHIFPPGEELKLRDNFGNLILRFDPKMYENVKYYEIIQEKGDAIFVPSNWFHQVINVTNTISINHNWVNGCNIAKVWEALSKNLVAVEKELKEFKILSDYSSMCQTLLKSLFGMDYEGFANMLIHIAEKRLAQLEGGLKVSFDNNVLGNNHCIYDCKCINDVINMMKSDKSFEEFNIVLTENLQILQETFTYILA